MYLNEIRDMPNSGINDPQLQGLIDWANRRCGEAVWRFSELYSELETAMQSNIRI